MCFRLSDRSQNGDYNGATEIVTYYDDVTGAVPLTNPTCIAVGPLGRAFIADSTEDLVLWMRDGNGDGDALDPGEHGIFFDNTNVAGIVMASAQGITVDAIGAVFVAVSNAGTTGTDMILRLFDLNGDGDCNDVGEAADYCTIPGGSAPSGTRSRPRWSSARTPTSTTRMSVPRASCPRASIASST